MTGPLEGVKVLDVSRVLAGPFCSMILGDLGADIIKVEPPQGDLTRSWGPPFLVGESGYYLSVNRNKRSICLDLSKEEARQVLRDLASECDVFLENFRPGVAKRLQMDYQAIQRLRPDVVYCSISGYGQDGPYRDKPSFDIILQGLGGFMGITGEEGGPPVRIGVATADLGAGLHAAIAILAALLRRSRGGGGDYIDVSILDGQVFWLTYAAQHFFLTGKSPPRMGSRHPQIMPYQTFPTRDGHIVVAAASQKFWEGLCGAVGREDLLRRREFSTNELRVVNREELEHILEGVFRTRDTKAWVQALEAGGIPCGPVNAVEQVVSDPQVLHRGMIQEMEHPRLGTLKLLAPPFKFDSGGLEARIPPPLKGEHSQEILAGLGYDEGAIKELEQGGAVVTRG